MTFKQDFQILVNTMPSLALAISRLIEQQEKDWGCFQIKKGEDRVYRLYIPSLPILRFKTSSNCTYRAFWGNNNRSSVYSKQDQKTLTLTKSELTKIQRNQSKSKFELKTEELSLYSENNASLANAEPKKQVILSNSRKSSSKSSAKPELVTMKQKTYEIVYYRSSVTPELNTVNQMIAGFLREKIENITSESLLASNEIRPLIITTVKN